MPDGKTHAMLTATAGTVVAITMLRHGFSATEVILVSEGCIASFFLNPDLDVDGGNIGYSWIDKYFGKFAGIAWRAVWWPYAVLMPHRSFWSHAPVVSTLLRVTYWYIAYVLVAKVLGLAVYVPTQDQIQWWLFGLILSDSLHFLADIIATAVKKRRRRVV